MGHFNLLRDSIGATSNGCACLVSPISSEHRSGLLALRRQVTTAQERAITDSAGSLTATLSNLLKFIAKQCGGHAEGRGAGAHGPRCGGAAGPASESEAAAGGGVAAVAVDAAADGVAGSVVYEVSEVGTERENGKVCGKE